MHFRTLVFPAGTEIGLEILAALGEDKAVTLFGAGTGASNPASLRFERYFNLPHVDEPGWVGALNQLIAEHEIGWIVPAHDDALLALARAATQLQARVVTSPLETCEITRSKSATYRRVAGALAPPRVYEPSETPEMFPVFAKPDRGQGSAGAHVVQDAAALVRARETPGTIVCEYLPGEEFTIDCFADRTRGLLFAGARQRLRMRNGIAVHTQCVELPEAWALAEALLSRLDFHGAFFLQVKRDANGALRLLEAAPRIAGSMAAHRVRGVNFPLLSLYEAAGVSIDMRPLDCRLEIDRALANRYRHDIRFEAVYVDLDDTLVHRGRVHQRLIGFLHACIDDGKPVTLLTRHNGALDAVLRKHRLEGLFDTVVHVGREPKSAHVAHERAIFIDDSFTERREVAETCNIPTFDLSMIEMLTEAA